MTTQGASDSSSHLWSWIAEWWMAKSRQRQAVSEIDQLDPGTASDMSRDLGASVGELRALAGKWPDASPELLTRRLQALDLDPAEVARKEPAVARDLAVHCSLCTGKTRCRHDLDRKPDDPAWRKYCANTVTLDALKAERPTNGKP
ncbi:DUF6455 family protein [Rhodoplanes sp. Z2-YC6860]|uniref:DUF6455 family protein n=1 Tax=Rhodoplanes sp. Z2-YC6860 TaxID=674703 RepID=UPI00078C642C|nr:DUF6455 family protein [Rhodoplanes sp. Z2-YC6860]AMN45007.1 hypothetical protein RHPLAN_66010 [Rhodoplanes sp. Z2-YC6860]